MYRYDSYKCRALFFKCQHAIGPQVLYRRALVSYWRSPNYNVLRAIITLVCGFVFGTLFLARGNKRWVHKSVQHQKL